MIILRKDLLLGLDMFDSDIIEQMPVSPYLFIHRMAHREKLNFGPINFSLKISLEQEFKDEGGNESTERKAEN